MCWKSIQYQVNGIRLGSVLFTHTHTHLLNQPVALGVLLQQATDRLEWPRFELNGQNLIWKQILPNNNWSCNGYCPCLPSTCRVKYIQACYSMWPISSLDGAQIYMLLHSPPWRKLCSPTTLLKYWGKQCVCVCLSFPNMRLPPQSWCPWRQTARL